MVEEAEWPDDVTRHLPFGRALDDGLRQRHTLLHREALEQVLDDLRHTCATLLLKGGEHIKVVSERLGHANVAITLEIYVHVLPGMQQDTASRMEALLGGDGGTPAAHSEAHRDEEEED